MVERVTLLRGVRGSKSDAPLLLALVWGLSGFLISAVLHDPESWPATLGVVMITQAFAGGIAWVRLGASRTAVLPDFLTIFLTFQVINKTLTFLNLVVRGSGVEGVRSIGVGFEELTPLTNVFRWQAEWIFLAGTVLFTIGWLLVERRRPLLISFEPAPKTLWRAFFWSLAIYTLISWSGIAVGMLASLLKLFSLGALAVLLGGNSRYALGRDQSWLTVAAMVPLLFLALQSGVKGEFALVALPILLPILKKITALRLLGVAGFIAIVVLIVFPISEEARLANWESYGGTEKAGTVELLSRVNEKWDQQGVTATAVDGTFSWLARGSTADIGGLVMQIADRDGHLGPELIKGLLYIFVPRLLWPEKPSSTPGAWFTWYLGHAPSPESATSATATMLPTEIYWMFGGWGVLVGMTLLGVLYALIWKALHGMSKRSPIAQLALFAFVVRAANLESTHSLYAIAEPVTFFVYVMLLVTVSRLMLSPSPSAARLKGVRF